MSVPVETAESPAPAPEPTPPRRGRLIFTLLAWIVIIGLAGLLIYLPIRRTRGESAAEGSAPSLLAVRLLGRYYVGAESLTHTRDPRLLDQARQLDTGPPDQRWRYIVLTGELGGPDAALEHLQELDRNLVRHQIRLDPTQQAIRRALGQLYEDYRRGDWHASSLGDADRDLLQSQLGWFGRLALNPEKGPNPAERDAVLRPAIVTAIGMGVLFLGLIGVGLLGVLALILFIALWAVGILHGRLGGPTAHGGVYAETFAIWMLLYLGLSIVNALIRVGENGLLQNIAAGLLSLAALGWPVLRGISWRQVRQDVGLTLGSQPAVEPAAGVASYVTAIPLVLLGAGIMLLLLRLRNGPGPVAAPHDNFGSDGMPSHPIVQYVAGSGWWLKLQLFVLASVIAPIVEETMFRGVLYRHLRDATHRLGATASALLSATFVSFLFAAIHPQGLLAIPVLMAVAYGLALAREWRGSLLPGMVAHGLNNSLVVALLFLASGD
jgi:membrane protease YdiL (CAAX protease family)